MTEQKKCKVCQTLLVKKETKRTASQLTKPYYYSAYYLCPNCHRLYHDDSFKVINKTMNFIDKNSIISQQYDVEIWTDGACVNNGKPTARAAWAFVSGKKEEAGEVDGNQTNNRAEGLAIYYGLKWAAEKGHKKIKLYTDSQITLHGVMKDPKAVKANADIFIKIRDVVNNNNLDVIYEKVLGHSGIEENERVDKLATQLAGSLL